MESGELRAWLRLCLTDGIGPVTARKLLACFGLPTAIFAQSARTLEQVVTSAQAHALLAHAAELDHQIEITRRWLDDDRGVDGQSERRILTLADPDYPPGLLTIDDPPTILYGIGVPDWPRWLRQLSPGLSLAVVGSRNPTAQGAANAFAFSRELAQSGLVIVSGLALGVDGKAHEGALADDAETRQLHTVAVVGTGVDRVYPRHHRELAHRITQAGLILSEYPIGTPPLAAHFPRRNRLLAGLTRGTLVVEAAPQSGSLITARLAAEQGREVFAIPGSIHTTQARGCHALIKQGAKLVESAQDVLEELSDLRGAIAARSTDLSARGVAGSNPGSGQPEESLAIDDPILNAMGFDPVSLDALLARTGLPTPLLQARLLELELEDRVTPLPGGLFLQMTRA